MKLTVDIQKSKTIIQDTEDELLLTLTKGKGTGDIVMGIEAGKIKAIAAKLTASYEKVLSINFSWDIEKSYVLQYLVQTATDGGIKLEEKPKEIIIPKNMYKTIADEVQKLFAILETFGYKLRQEKAKPAKAVHRWSKAVSEIDFFVDYQGAKATCRWQKRNEMLVKKGAVLVAETPLNKDGSVGFAAKFTLSLRDMYQDKIDNFTTTEDIVLKSVNEVGNFLYFAGTNSWLVLKDEEGKTIDEYTVVK